MSTPHKPLPPHIDSRTPADYEILVEQALSTLALGIKPELPQPQSRAELMVLLNRASKELDKLSDLLAETGLTEPGPGVNLSKLSFDEKMALGEEQSRKLSALAFELAPVRTLDSLEKGLPSDASSQAQAQSLLARLAAGGRPASL